MGKAVTWCGQQALHLPRDIIPKAFYNYVNSKTKTGVTVSDLINDIDGTVASYNKERADALNRFFSSVFYSTGFTKYTSFWR